MASLFTDARRTEMYQFFNVAFNAAPGLIYLSQLRDAVESGLSTKDIVNIFTTKSQFLSVYPSILTNLDFANRLVNNVIKDSASSVAKMEAVNDIVSSLNLGLSRGDVIFQVFSNLANITDPGNRYFGVATQFQKQLIVARYYTEALLGSAEDVLTLQRVIRNVTNNSDVSTDAAIQNLINGGTSGANANLVVTAQAPSVNEGTSTFFSITGADANSDLSFTITGVQQADILGGQLTGTTRSDSNGNAFVSLGILNDNLTEGTEVLTFTVAGKSASTNIVDTSRGNNSAPVAPAVTNQAAEGGPAISGTIAATDANGDVLAYSLVTPVPGLILNSNGTYTFNPASNPTAQSLRYSDPAAQIVANYSVSDGQANATNTLTITVTPTPLTFTITPSASSAEGAPATFVVTASESLTSNLDVQFTVNPGSTSAANSGTSQTNLSDFSPGTLSRTITIPAGSNTATFTLTPAGDALTELSESYTVTAAVNGTTLTASGSVADAAPPQAFTLTASPTPQTVVEGNTGTTPLSYTLTLNQAPTSAVTFNVAAATGNNATQGSDFNILASTITFNTGETTKTINLAEVIGDVAVEGPETFVLRISGPNLPQNVDLAVNITDDDSGSNFILTTAADNYTGTGNADTITGVVSGLVTAATFTSTDRIDGAGGNDTLNLRLDGDFPGVLGQAFPANPTGTQGFVRNVETLALTNGGNAARTFNAANITGVTALQWTNSATANGSLNVQNLGQAITSLTVNGLIGANNNVTLNHLATLNTGLDSLALTLNGVGAQTAGTTAAVPVTVVSTGVSVEKADLTVIGNNALTLAGAGAVGSNAITVAGSGNLELTGSSSTLISFDASAASGTINATLSNTTLPVVIATIRGGSGNDVITVDAASVQGNATLSGGAGTDDRLVISSIGKNLAPTLSGFETLEFRGITAASAIAGSTGSGGVKTVVLNTNAAASASNALTLTGIFDGAGLTVQTQGANSTALNVDNLGPATFRTVASSTATGSVPDVVTSAVTFSQATGIANVEIGSNTIFNGTSPTDGFLNFTKAAALVVDAKGALGTNGINGSAEVSAAIASSVILKTTASPSGLATPLKDRLAVIAPNATSLSITANRDLDIKGSDLTKVQGGAGTTLPALISTTGVLDGTDVDLSAISSLMLNGDQSTSKITLGNIGAAAQTYSANVTATGLQGGLTLKALDSREGVSLNLSNISGEASIDSIGSGTTMGTITASLSGAAKTTVTGGIQTTGAITINAGNTSNAAVVMTGAVGNMSTASVNINAQSRTADLTVGLITAKTVDAKLMGSTAALKFGAISGAETVSIDARNSVGLLTIGDGLGGGNDITVKNSLTYFGSSLSPSSFDVQADTGSKVLSVALMSGLEADSYSIKGVSGQTEISVTGDLGNGLDTISVVSSASSVAQIISLGGLSNVEQTTITGGSGIDKITGSTGNDVITGGAGADVIDGGAGADKIGYAVLATDGTDSITFDAADDYHFVDAAGGYALAVTVGAGALFAATNVAVAAANFQNVVSNAVGAGVAATEVLVFRGAAAGDVYANSSAAIAAYNAGSTANDIGATALIVIYETAPDIYRMSYDANGATAGGETVIATFVGLTDALAAGLAAGDFLFSATA